MLARGADGWSEAGRDERPGTRTNGAEARPKTQRQCERKLMRVTGEGMARILPEIEALGELRDEMLEQLGEKADCRMPSFGEDETGSFLLRLTRILEHGISSLEDGYAELEGAFSREGLAELRRRVRKGEKRSRP